jgi:hypothetical protein
VDVSPAFLCLWSLFGDGGDGGGVRLGMAAVVYDVDGVLLVVGLLSGDSNALEGGYDGFDVLLLLQLLMALLRGAGVGGWG